MPVNIWLPSGSCIDALVSKVAFEEGRNSINEKKKSTAGLREIEPPQRETDCQTDRLDWLILERDNLGIMQAMQCGSTLLRIWADWLQQTRGCD